MTEDGVIVQTLGDSRRSTSGWGLRSPRWGVGVGPHPRPADHPVRWRAGVRGVLRLHRRQGTYTLDILHNTFTSRGIYTVAIDGTTITTIDGYYNPSGGPALFVDTAVANLFLDAGNHVLSFTMGAKNASASAYYGALNSALLTKGL